MLIPFTAPFVRTLLIAASVFTLFLTTPPALAEDLTAELVASKVTQDADGTEVLVPADKGQPGDVIEYVATYTNKSGKDLLNLKAVVPIPAGTEYLNGTAKPKPPEASLDGQKFDPIPLKRTVKLADGSAEVQPVPPTEYRALRWDIGELAPGKAAKVSARVRLLTNSAEEAE